MMKLANIPLNQIEIGTRFRQDLGNIDELVADIREKGLITPIAVQEDGNGTFKLLAGGRRLTAVTALKFETIPARVFSEDSLGTNPEQRELMLRSIELSENLYRKDLSWKEQADLQAEIHRLHIKIHGPASNSPTAGGWRMEDTAQLIGKSKQLVSIDLQLSTAANSFPELFADCRTRNDASKVLKKMQISALESELSKKLEAEAQSNTQSVLKQLSDNFIIRDFFEGVAQIPDGTFNLVEMDPPYSINLGSDGKSQRLVGIEHYNEVDQDQYLDFIKRTLTECYRVMAQHSWLIMWFSPEPWFESIYQIATSIGFTGRRIPIIWSKPGASTTSNPIFQLGSSYEMAFYFSKGAPGIAKQGSSNLFTYINVPPSDKTHPTERPLSLIRDILSTFTGKGSRVLVPFLGSGTTLIAAYQLGMNAIGFELSKPYKDSFVVRVAKLGPKFGQSSVDEPTTGAEGSKES